MKKILVVVKNHFDLAWRRSLNKKMVDNVYEELSEIWADIDKQLSELRSFALKNLITSAGDLCISVSNPAGDNTARRYGESLPAGKLPKSVPHEYA